MQAQHDHHETAIGIWGFHRFAGTRVDHEAVGFVRVAAGSFAHDGVDAVGVIVVPAEVLHHVAGAVGFG